MIQNKKILVLGMARSGISVSKLLSKYNNKIIITDIKNQNKDEVDELKKLGIDVIITKNQYELVTEDIDLMIKNPAIKKDNKAVIKANNLNIPVINEIEASYKFLPKDVKIIAITGSNGKTTTTTITYELLKYKNSNVHLGGNIGIPLSSLVNYIKSGDILVLEISDHQLCDMYEFKSDISVLTNLSEVHIDFHDTYENYKNIKRKVFNNHTKNDIAILNKDNLDVIKLTENIVSNKIFFSSSTSADIYLNDNNIVYNNEIIINCNDIKIKGKHNYENIMVAIIIAKMFNVSNDDIKDFLSKFGGVEHRMEYVRTLNNRKFYNDSKATNNKSTMIALDSFREPTILIMGGLDRNIPFDELSTHVSNVKYIISYGETKYKIKEFADRNNILSMVVNNLRDATNEAYKLSKKGDVILLSPACASWDQYSDFESRGNEFKNIVNNLK